MVVRTICREIAFLTGAVVGLSASGMAFGQDRKLDQITITDDGGSGIVAVIELIPPKAGDGSEYVGTTDRDGTLRLDPPVACPQRYRLNVRVEAGRYLPRSEDCQKIASPFTTKLTSWTVITSLYRSFDRPQNEPGRAAAVKALLANDLAFRLQAVPTTDLQGQLTAARKAGSSEVATVLQKELASRTAKSRTAPPKSWAALVFESVGALLGVANPTVFDPAQGRFVMSVDLSRAVSQFQTSSGIKRTGAIDYKTLSTLSNSDIGKVIYPRKSPTAGSTPGR